MYIPEVFALRSAAFNHIEWEKCDGGALQEDIRCVMREFLGKFSRSMGYIGRKLGMRMKMTVIIMSDDVPVLGSAFSPVSISHIALITPHVTKIYSCRSLKMQQ
jgi:hypothetical protein